MPDWFEVIWRTVIAFIVLFIIARVLGKRQITQLTYFEYITGITIGSLAAYISLDLEDHWIMGIISLAVWGLIILMLEFLTLKSKHIRDWVEGKGTVLIKDGKIMEDNLQKVRYSADELLAQLRKKNVFNASDVEFAVLETSGELSVLLRRENQPLTPKHLGINIPNEQEPQTVIMDGQIIDEALATIGFSRAWLRTELEKKGVTLENVYLAQADAYGQLTVDLYDDQIKVPAPKERKLLSAQLKKCAADLELFALSTKNKQAKAMYAQNLRKLNEVIASTKPFLQ